MPQKCTYLCLFSIKVSRSSNSRKWLLPQEWGEQRKGVVNFNTGSLKEPTLSPLRRGLQSGCSWHVVTHTAGSARCWTESQIHGMKKWGSWGPRKALKLHSLRSRPGSSFGKRDFRIGQLAGGVGRGPHLGNSSRVKMQLRNEVLEEMMQRAPHAQVTPHADEVRTPGASGISVFETSPSDSQLGPRLRASA